MVGQVFSEAAVKDHFSSPQDLDRESYLNLLQEINNTAITDFIENNNYCIHFIHRKPVNFQHDGAPSYYALSDHNYLARSIIRYLTKFYFIISQVSFI